MKEPSKLLLMMFETDRWQRLLDQATEKGIDKKIIKELCYPEKRKELFKIIYEDKYNIFPPHISLIPKDKPGEYRQVYINEGQDRIVLTLINDCLCELFKPMIHPKCVSYQKGIGTQKIVKEISNEIVSLNKKNCKKSIGYKVDFSKYFDNVLIECIDNIFDTIEKKLGFSKNTEPVMNLLRRYYHQDLYFDLNGELQEKYQSLKQGCSCASFIANIVLYELDEYMSNKYKIYYRYCDDAVIIDNDTSNVIEEMNSIIAKYGVSLNPKKVESLYADKWFKFLGFNIKGELITLSKNRVKKFQKEIEKRSIKMKKTSGEKARKAIIKYLYEGEHSWASSCLTTINVDEDIKQLDKFLIDAIKASETGKKRIGGLGTSFEHGDKTILRGRGRNVRANREKIPHIDNYNTLKCMRNNMLCGKEVFEMSVRNMFKG